MGEGAYNGPKAHNIRARERAADSDMRTEEPPNLVDTLDRAYDLIRDLRRTMDHDEGGLPFEVRHNDLARCHYVRHESGIGMTQVCHCRLLDTINECLAVEKEIERLRDERGKNWR